MRDANISHISKRGEILECQNILVIITYRRSVEWSAATPEGIEMAVTINEILMYYEVIYGTTANKKSF